MDKQIEKILANVVSKFEKIQLYEEMKNEEKAIEIIKDIEDFEIDVLDYVGKMFVEMADLIRQAKK